MHFRDYREGDFVELSELWNSIGLGGSERNDSEAFIIQTIAMGGKLILLENEHQKIIGSCWMTFDGRRIHMHHFGIARKYQNRGLGTRLARKSLQYIKEKNIQVKLEVHKENVAAKRIYEKMGFIAYTDYDIYMIRKPSNINV